MRERKFYQRIASADVEFLADIVAMIFDGSQAQTKVVSDFAARFRFGNLP